MEILCAADFFSFWSRWGGIFMYELLLMSICRLWFLDCSAIGFISVFLISHILLVGDIQSLCFLGDGELCWRFLCMLSGSFWFRAQLSHCCCRSVVSRGF
jgi:hypothetical protein